MAAERRERHVTLYGLEVTDEAQYQRYRAGMTPILHRYGGAFGYDFVVSEVLKSEVDAPMNRVFTLAFPDAEVSERFFADPEYLAVRARLFKGAVAHVSKLASYHEPAPTLA